MTRHIPGVLNADAYPRNLVQKRDIQPAIVILVTTVHRYILDVVFSEGSASMDLPALSKGQSYMLPAAVAHALGALPLIVLDYA